MDVRHFLGIVLLFCSFLVTSGCSTTQTAATDPGVLNLREQALRELKEVLHQQNEWVKVHAAEYLLWTGHPEEVQEVFLSEAKRFGNLSPYRIGIWRVLAQAATSKSEKEVWIGKIKEAFLDIRGKDRIHASETLAKLRSSPYALAPEITRQALASESRPLALYTAWATAHASADSMKSVRTQLLAGLASKHQDAFTKRLAGYILRHLGELTAHQWQQLAQVALSEPDNSDAKVYLLSAAFVQAPASQENTPAFDQIRQKLLIAPNARSKGDRIEMAMALAERGTSEEIPVLISMLSNENPLAESVSVHTPEELRNSPENADVRAAAAFAILKITSRHN